MVIDGVIVDVGDLLDLASVDVTERELVEHVLVGDHAQFLLQDFGLFRPDALQIGDTRLQQVQFHGTKVVFFGEDYLFICL